MPLVARWSTLAPNDPIFASVTAVTPGANVGLRLDGLVVVDCDSPVATEWWRGLGFHTDFVSRGREDRRSFWYRLPQGAELRPGKIGSDIDVKCGPGHQCVIPPSIHPTGRAYEWLGPPVDEAHWWEIPEAPVEALVEWRGQAVASGVEGWSCVEDGGRDNFLASVAGFFRSKGVEPGTIRAVLGAVNQIMCVPPKRGVDLDRIASSIGRYEVGGFQMEEDPDLIEVAEEVRQWRNS